MRKYSIKFLNNNIIHIYLTIGKVYKAQTRGIFGRTGIL